MLLDKGRGLYFKGWRKVHYLSSKTHRKSTALYPTVQSVVWSKYPSFQIYLPKEQMQMIGSIKISNLEYSLTCWSYKDAWLVTIF